LAYSRNTPKGDAQSIPKGWVETTLGGVADIKYGKDHKKLNNGNIPCLGSGGIMLIGNWFKTTVVKLGTAEPTFKSSSFIVLSLKNKYLGIIKFSSISV
jgi:hypothetical protein